jgi:hypothetical protein
MGGSPLLTYWAGESNGRLFGGLANRFDFPDCALNNTENRSMLFERERTVSRTEQDGRITLHKLRTTTAIVKYRDIATDAKTSTCKAALGALRDGISTVVPRAGCGRADGSSLSNH